LVLSTIRTVAHEYALNRGLVVGKQNSASCWRWWAGVGEAREKCKSTGETFSKVLWSCLSRGIAPVQLRRPGHWATTEARWPRRRRRSFGQTGQTSPLANLGHLDFLGAQIAPPSQAGHTTYNLGAEPSIGVLWVYANYRSPGTYQVTGGGNYDAATNTYGQGAFDADDISRLRSLMYATGASTATSIVALPRTSC